jgi:hypothetical protein
MRFITDNVSQWSCGRYFFFWQGDELLMKATTDAEAIIEGKALQAELESSEM